MRNVGLIMSVVITSMYPPAFVMDCATGEDQTTYDSKQRVEMTDTSEVKDRDAKSFWRDRGKMTKRHVKNRTISADHAYELSG
jgi:hypothetical protein